MLAALALHDWSRAADIPGALHLMAKRGDEAAVTWLLDHGADLNALWSHWGADVTPLHLAVLGAHAAVVKLLLEHGADPSIRDSMHDSDPAGWAEFLRRPHAAALLALAQHDEQRLKRLLHPYVRCGDIRGRTNVLARLDEIRPPREVELRDGQIYRWTA